MVVCNWKNISGIQTCMNFSIVIMVNIFSIIHIFQQICVFSTEISKYKIGKFSTKISTRNWDKISSKNSAKIATELR